MINIFSRIVISILKYTFNAYLDIKNVGVVKAIPRFFPYLRNNNILNPYKHYDMKGSLEIHKKRDFDGMLQ